MSSGVYTSLGCVIRCGELLDFDEEHEEVVGCPYLVISECIVS